MRALLVLAFAATAAADPVYPMEAVQTDWTGGPGIPMYSMEFGDGFLSCDDGMIWTVPGFLLLNPPVDHLVSSGFDRLEDIHSCDLDGDGDVDMAAVTYLVAGLFLIFNTDGMGGAWSVVELAVPAISEVMRVIPFDADDDGDVDLAIQLADSSVLAENVSGTGLAWEFRTIGQGEGLREGDSGDIDGDGDLDLVWSIWGDGARWFENADSAGGIWVEHDIEAVGSEWAYDLALVDMDGDGSLDICGMSLYSPGLFWLDNAAPAGWVLHDIDWQADWYFACADFDGDGDVDVASCTSAANQIILHRNIGGQGLEWSQELICELMSITYSPLTAADFDLDGSMDLLADLAICEPVVPRATWLDNGLSEGQGWSPHMIDFVTEDSYARCTGDFDGDGIPDAAASPASGTELHWWSILGSESEGALISSILHIPEPTDWVGWGALTWDDLCTTGANVCFQVRASEDPGQMGEWSDTIWTSGFDLSTILGDQEHYVQYRAILGVYDPLYTAILDQVSLGFDPGGGITQEGGAPETFFLDDASPNPAAGFIRMSFGLPCTCPVAIRVYDLSGRAVASFDEPGMLPGTWSFFQSIEVPGTYLVLLRAGDFTASRKATVI
jgi:hypothetical protein